MDGNLFKFLFLCVYLHICDAVSNCKVSDFAVQGNFDLNKYLGTWYEIKWLPQSYIPPEYLYQNYEHTYKKISDDIIEISVTGRDPAKIDVCFSYKAWLQYSSDTSAKLRYTRTFNATANITSDYWIIQTDYVNYAVVFGCRVFNATGTCDAEDSWVWSRTTSLTSQQMKTVDSTLQNICLNVTAFLPTSHAKTECGRTSGSCTIYTNLLLLLFATLFATLLRRTNM